MTDKGNNPLHHCVEVGERGNGAVCGMHAAPGVIMGCGGQTRGGEKAPLPVVSLLILILVHLVSPLPISLLAFLSGRHEWSTRWMRGEEHAVCLGRKCKCV